MMGAGKTRVGERLAEVLGWVFVDLDARIEESAGRSVVQVFGEEGEEAFRRLERETLECVLTEESDGLVLALGGGTYVQEGVRELLSQLGVTVFIDVSVDALVVRLSDPAERTKRPLIGQDLRVSLSHLLDARLSRFRDAEIVVDGEQRPSVVASDVITALGALGDAPGEMAALKVELPGRAYPIWVGPGGAEDVARRLVLFLESLDSRPAKVAIVTDEKLARMHLDALSKVLDLASWPVTIVVVPEGEKAKSLDVLGDVWSQLLEARLGRRDMVVAFGGGVVGDLAGFAAATLLRGVRLIQVPTTLLAQVDSSVGGKTGINHGLGKNLVGAFHQPEAVLIGMGMLRTLEARQVRSGLAEVVKYAMIDGEDFFEELERDAEEILARPWAQASLVARCCAIKARVVQEDERESGRRALLNLGHTFGHAIEAMEGFGGVTHGEGVGLGMILAVRAANSLGLGAEGIEERLVALLERWGLPTCLKRYLGGRREMARWMENDKKATGRAVTFILPKAIGDVVTHVVETGSIPVLLEELASYEKENYSF
jgi:shikimate kinase/3-dehydroquinate synthase